MDDASGQSCVMFSGAHRSDSVLHDRGQKQLVRSKHPHVQLNRFVSKHHGAQHTPDLSLSAASVVSDAAALLPCTADDVSAITQCACIPACRAQGPHALACLCLSKQDTVWTDVVTGNTQDWCGCSK